MTLNEINKNSFFVEAAMSIRTASMKKFNIVINGKRTSITMEPILWDILKTLSKENNMTVHEFCGFVNERKSEKLSLAGAVRMFVVSYLFGRLYS